MNTQPHIICEERLHWDCKMSDIYVVQVEHGANYWPSKDKAVLVIETVDGVFYLVVK